ncbi:MAG: hypothetical protein L6Q33_10940, partial [Bacteriovoracaceae bacterium]|nr:hypothetical protein [Bacteriovoracaceae bacterium]
FKYQWNWGWINPREKKPFTMEEKELAISELKKTQLPKDMPKDLIDDFVRDNFPDIVGVN